MIDVMAIQPLLGRSTTTMLKSNFISIANARQNRVYNTISPRIYKFAIKHNICTNSNWHENFWNKIAGLRDCAKTAGVCDAKSKKYFSQHDK